MNFWTFLDRNGMGLALLVLAAIVSAPLIILATKADAPAVAPCKCERVTP